MPINWNISSYTTLPSTQDKLRKILDETPHLNEGFAICAEEQSSGRARHGRKWEDGKGNLFISFLLRPEKDRSFCSQLSLIVGISLVEVIKDQINLNCNIILKWPNDVLLYNKKCAGILLEAMDIEQQEYPVIIVGVGVNISSAPIEMSACLNGYMNDLIVIDRFKASFFSIFENNYQRWKKFGFKVFKSCFLDYTYPKGSRIGVKIAKNSITGEFIDIDEVGNLKLLCDRTQKVRKISSGDVFLI